MNGKKTVMLLDDEVAITAPFEMILKLNGFVTATYTSAHEAYEAIRDGIKYDVLIADISVGEHSRTSGDFVINFSKERYPNKPVISFSAYSSRAPKADFHLHKPVAGQEVVRKINEALSEFPNHAEE